MIRYMKKISNNVFCSYKAYEENWSIYIRKVPFPTLITIFWIKKQQITLKLLETKELVLDYPLRPNHKEDQVTLFYVDRASSFIISQISKFLNMCMEHISSRIVIIKFQYLYWPLLVLLRHLLEQLILCPSRYVRKHISIEDEMSLSSQTLSLFIESSNDFIFLLG